MLGGTGRQAGSSLRYGRTLPVAAVMAASAAQTAAIGRSGANVSRLSWPLPGMVWPRRGKLTAPAVFDHRLKRAQRHGVASGLADGGREFEYLRTEVGTRLVGERLPVVAREFPDALALGAGASLLGSPLSEAGKGITNLTICDDVEPAIARDSEGDADLPCMSFHFVGVTRL